MSKFDEILEKNVTSELMRLSASDLEESERYKELISIYEGIHRRDNDRKERRQKYILGFTQNAVTLLVVVVEVVEGIWTVKESLAFEKTDCVTSIAGRSKIESILRRKLK